MMALRVRTHVRTGQAAPGIPGGGGGTTVTWDPAVIGANTTLSNGNLTAEHTGSTGAFETNRATLGRANNAGVYYWEITANVIFAAGQKVRFGMVGASTPLNTQMGSEASAITVEPGGQSSGNGGTGSNTTWDVGDVIGFLLESSSSVKAYKNGVLASTFTTGNGLLPTTAVWYPAGMTVWQTDKFTANFGATAFAFPPAGSTSWDGSQTH